MARNHEEIVTGGLSLQKEEKMKQKKFWGYTCGCGNSSNGIDSWLLRQWGETAGQTSREETIAETVKETTTAAETAKETTMEAASETGQTKEYKLPEKVILGR